MRDGRPRGRGGAGRARRREKAGPEGQRRGTRTGRVRRGAAAATRRLPREGGKAPRREAPEAVPDADDTDSVVIRLVPRAAPGEAEDLREHAAQLRLRKLASFLRSRPLIPTRRVVWSLPPEAILALERQAQISEFPPLHSLTAYWRLDCRGVEDVDALVEALQALPEVDVVYRELPVSQPQVNSADDPHCVRQTYLDPAPIGIDARWAWTQPAGDGAGVALIDLEQTWVLNHEDLTARNATVIFNDNRYLYGYAGDHGAAVLAEVAGVDNTVGVVGVAPGVSSVRVVSHYEAATGTIFHVAAAVVAAVAALGAGDVLLLEVQRGTAGALLPTEIDAADFDAIRLASALGIIVVEAAANSGLDLNAFPVLNPGHPNFRDSGAIMVGGAHSGLPHDRWISPLGSSNHGARVNCYGWSENVTTAGYGGLSPAGAPDAQKYTAGFYGTSAAAPIIAGAALIVQGAYQAASPGARLSPSQMRVLLADPATGTVQGTGKAGNIGVMPNLRAILTNALGLVPDVYVRDDLGDTGTIPSAGAISLSPDIIVTSPAAANPEASFGQGSGTENVNTLGRMVEAGRDNYVYVRLSNRGAGAALGAKATAFWSEPATLLTPNLWNKIGTSAAVDVPQGRTLVVAGPIVWPSNAVPATGHYCFVALADHAQDPTPVVPPATDWNGFQAFIRNNNNVTWRNFNVITAASAPFVKYSPAHFLVTGTLDEARVFGLEIVQALPEGVRVAWEMPIELFTAIGRERFASARIDSRRHVATVRLPAVPRLPLGHVRLPRAARYPCRLLVRAAEGLGEGWHTVAIRQFFEGLEVGRVTWAVRAERRLR